MTTTDHDPRAKRLTDLADLLIAAADQIREVVAESHHQPDRSSETAIIKGVVAGYYGVTGKDLASPSRMRRHAHPRRVAMHLMRKMTGLTLEDIGKQFGARDHTTVIYALNTIADELSNNPSLVAQLTTLTALIEKEQAADE